MAIVKIHNKTSADKDIDQREIVLTVARNAISAAIVMANMEAPQNTNSTTSMWYSFPHPGRISKGDVKEISAFP